MLKDDIQLVEQFFSFTSARNQGNEKFNKTYQAMSRILEAAKLLLLVYQYFEDRDTNEMECALAMGMERLNHE